MFVGFFVAMGNRHSFEKQYIEQQGRAPTTTQVVDDVLDNPNLTDLQHVPQYLKFICPSAVDKPQSQEFLRQLMLKPQEQTKLNLSSSGWTAAECSLLLPLILQRCSALQEVNLTGLSVDLSLLAASVGYARSVNLIVLNNVGAPFFALRQFSQMMLSTQPRNVRLVIQMDIGNPFWDQSPQSTALNDGLESTLNLLLQQTNVSVVGPPKPESPFFVNNVPVYFSQMNTNQAVGGTFVTEYNVNLETRDDAHEKIQFLESTINYIAGAQRQPNRDLGLQFIPQFYYCKLRSPVALTIVHEDVGRLKNYVPVEQLWSPRTLDNFTMHWRLTIALQVAYVAKFLHSLPKPAGLREIFPLSLLVDTRQQRIMYTNIESFRAPGVNSIFHGESKKGVRCVDPSENNLVDFSLPGDIYALAMALVFFIIPISPKEIEETNPSMFDKKNFKNFFQPPHNPKGDFVVQKQHFQELLGLAQGLNPEMKDILSTLVSECTMKDHAARPSKESFISRVEEALRLMN